MAKPRIQFKYETREETVVVKKEVLVAKFVIGKVEVDNAIGKYALSLLPEEARDNVASVEVVELVDYRNEEFDGFQIVITAKDADK
jgi:hypothetical protein